MGSRHPLPYAFAKANTLLLEDDGRELTLWAGEHASPTALSEVTRVYDIRRRPLMLAVNRVRRRWSAKSSRRSICRA